MVVEDRANFDTNLRKVHKGKYKGLQVDNQMFVRRKNEVVGELDDAVEILAAAFGVELYHILMRDVGFVPMLMPNAMMARFRRIDKAS